MEPKTPEAILPHAPDYKDSSWRQYTLEELGQWVALLAKRSTHRTGADKAAKDISDARNYLAMMSAHLDALSDD